MNSTLLSEVFSDMEVPQPLYPAIILTLRDSVPHPAPLGVFNANSLTDSKRLWRRAQYLANLFWTRWQKEYIQELHSRCKWRQPKRLLFIGDIVLLHDKQLPRNHWQLGKIVLANSDPDGHVTLVTVEISSIPFTSIRRCFIWFQRRSSESVLTRASSQ